MRGDLPLPPPERRGGLISQANHPPSSQEGYGGGHIFGMANHTKSFY